MKNFSLKFFGLSFALIAVSCSEDSTITNGQDAASALGVHKVTITAPASPNSRVSLSSTMLSFDSWTEFEETVTTLEEKVDDYDDRWLAGKESMTDDALNTLEDQTAYNVDKVLVDFENNLGFTNSLRKTYYAQESAYLADDVLDDNKDPDAKYLFADEELSLLNNNQEVMVAGEIFRFNLDGYTVYNSSYVQTGSFSVTATGGSCKSWKSSHSWVEYINNAKKVKRIATIRSFPSYCKTKVRVISYRKLSSGWKRYRTKLGVGVQANLYAAGKCDNVVNSGASGVKRKRRKALSKQMTTWGGFYTAKSGISVNGSYEYNGYYSSYSLQW
nr:hypothetical protein [uncultured Flavobacterium sp.]